MAPAGHWQTPFKTQLRDSPGSPVLGKTRAGGEGATEDELVGWHHGLSGHEFEQTPGASEGQASLAWCSPLGCKESDLTERPNNNRDSPGGPGAKTPRSYCRGPEFDLWSGN